MPYPLSKRRGQVTMTLEFINDAMEHGLQPFARMIPVHVDAMLYQGKIVVSGYSPDFDEVPEGEVTPEYDALFVEGRHAPHFRRR